jgi:RNA polymerase sigma factor (sigma-70 family)
MAEPRRRPLLQRLNDEHLARSVTAGNTRAYAPLYERYHQPVSRYCRSIVRDRADSEDVVQSTFTRALEALRRGQRDAPLRPWLFRIAHNEAVSLLRRRSAGDRAASELAHRCFAAVDPVPEQHRLASLMTDLQELPERQRKALLLHELVGLSHDEIATCFATSPGAVKQATFEARSALAQLTEGRAMACANVRQLISKGDGRLIRSRRLRAHLRDCHACAAFAAALPARRQHLRALSPALAVATAGHMLCRLLRVAARTCRRDPPGGTDMAAAAAGKLGGATVAMKALTSAAVVGGLVVGGADVVATSHQEAAQPIAVVSRELALSGYSRLQPLAPSLVAGPLTRARSPSRERPARITARAPSRGSSSSASDDQAGGNATRANSPAASHGPRAAGAAHSARGGAQAPASAGGHGQRRPGGSGLGHDAGGHGENGLPSRARGAGRGRPTVAPGQGRGNGNGPGGAGHANGAGGVTSHAPPTQSGKPKGRAATAGRGVPSAATAGRRAPSARDARRRGALGKRRPSITR